MEGFMRIRISKIIVLTLLLSSCMSYAPTINYPYNPITNYENAVVIDTVEAMFRMSIPSGIKAYDSRINDTSHTILFMTAREKYSGIIDIVDINWSEVDVVGTGKEKRYVYVARGKVIKLD
jgi:hypothetical protein